MTDLNKDEAKKTFLKKINSKWPWGLVLGLVGLIDAKGIDVWLNIYGRETVRHKLKNRQNICFISMKITQRFLDIKNGTIF